MNRRPPPRQPVEVRRLDPRRPVAADVAVAEVVGIDVDDVGMARSGGGTGLRQREAAWRKEIGVDSCRSFSSIVSLLRKQTMKYFLAKSEPGVYSIDDLERDEQDRLGRRHQRPGGKRHPRHEPRRPRLLLSQRRRLGDCRHRQRAHPQGATIRRIRNRPSPTWQFGGRLDPPTTLAEIKQSGKFDDWALVRQSRLSTMEAPEKFVEWMRARYPKAKI